jgi:hypothetical protein
VGQRPGAALRVNAGTVIRTRFRPVTVPRGFIGPSKKELRYGYALGGNDLQTQLDTRTLVVVSIMVALVPGMVGALVWQTRRTYPGQWALGNLLAALALLLLSLRGKVPDWISIVLANALAIGAGIVFLQGIRRFRGLRIRWWPECLVGVLGVATVTCFRYVTNNINIRILAMSFALGSIGIACGITLLKEMPRGPRLGLVVTGLVFTLGGAVHLLRGVYVFAFAPVTDLFDPSTSNAILFLGASLGVVTWSFGFIVLTAERLGINSKGVDNGSVAIATEEPPHAGQFQETVPDTEVRQQLRRIVESDVFRRSAQMERFLTLAVERALLGRPEELKEYALGRDVFHRGEDYDPRTDSIVRVEAQRLRRKLREYYDAQGSSDSVVITFPAGSYVPVFARQQRAPGQAHSQVAPS